MPLVNKPYTWANGQTADATQVDQNFDALYNLINGLLDTYNLATGAVLTLNLGSEAVTPAKTRGVPYATDIFGSNGFVQNGMAPTKDGTNLNQLNVSAGVAWVLQSDGTLRRFTPAAVNYKTTTANTTYYLDFNPDGTYTWGGHSSQSNYITICTVVSDGSGNISTITDTRTQYNGVQNANNLSIGTTSYPGSQSATANTVAVRDANGNVISAYPTSSNQNPNLLFNPTARLGLAGWSGSGWGAAFGSNGGGGHFQSPNVVSTGSYSILQGTSIPVSAGLQVTVSGEVNTSAMTAGQAWIEVDTSGGANIAAAIQQINYGQGWTKCSATFTMPASTTSLTIKQVLGNTALGQALFRKIKVEIGSIATTFSDDNTLNTQQYGSVLNMMQAQSGGWKIASGITGAMNANASAQTVTFPTPFSSTPAYVEVNPIVNGNAVTVDVNTTSASNFTFQSSTSAAVQYMWVAIGT